MNANSVSVSADEMEQSLEDQMLDEYLMQVYEKNISKINTIQKTMDISKVIAVISVLLFLILLAIKVDRDFTWFVPFIPAATALLSFAVLFNLFLKLKDIFDDTGKSEDKDKDDEESSHIGSNVSYFCLNLIVLNVLIYMILFSLKCDNIMESDWNVISIPIYIVFGIATFYAIFILPAFIQNKMYMESIMLFTYLICSFIFFILINLKGDKNIASEYFSVFLPFIFPLGLHFIYLISILVVSKKNNWFRLITESGWLFFLFVACVLIIAKADKVDSKTGYGYWLPVVMVLIGYCMFVSEKVLSFFGWKKESDEEEVKEK